MATVYGFGSVAVDFRIVTADFGKDYTQKLLAKETFSLPGGATSNALTQVARLGGKAVSLCKLGEDNVGDKIVDALTKENIDCSKIIRDKLVLSPFNVAVYAGENKRRVGGFLLPNALKEITKEDVDFFTENFKKGDYLLTEIGEIPLDIILYICKKAKEKGVKVVLDVDLDPITQCGSTKDLVDEIFKTVSILIPNRDSLVSIFPDMDEIEMAKKLKEIYNVLTVITMGSFGTCYAIPGHDEVYVQKAFKINAVDTIGAGDSFHGSLVYALSLNKPIENAVIFASKCAAINCTAFGATTAMPTLEILENFKFE